MIKAGIIGVTGYAGSELARLLYHHPQVKLTAVEGRSATGQKLGQVFPSLSRFDLTVTEHLGDVDVVFSGLPHKSSAEHCLPFIKKGVKVIDLSADFRLKSVAEYEQWYGVKHPAPELLEEAVYGLTELHREEVRGATLIANPGCYPTGAILALAPLVKHGLIEGDIIIDSKSGVSGAGRGLSLTAHFSEVNENVSAYALDGHRHLPEITQELGLLNPSLKLNVTFVPHLIPMTRGILSTCYARIKDGKMPVSAQGKQQLRDLYREHYRGEPFARVVDAPPQTKHTLGNNDCIIHPTLDLRTGRVIVISALDNLVKGAAGEAIQNMNLMFGLPEDTGLRFIAVYP